MKLYYTRRKAGAGEDGYDVPRTDTEHPVPCRISRLRLRISPCGISPGKRARFPPYGGSVSAIVRASDDTAFSRGTVWGEAACPYAKVFETMRDPGLGIRALHAAEVDGRGVGSAVIDKPILGTHAEFAGCLASCIPVCAHERTGWAAPPSPADKDGNRAGAAGAASCGGNGRRAEL